MHTPNYTIACTQAFVHCGRSKVKSMSEVDEQSRESQRAKQACEGCGTRNENPRVRSILEAFRNLSIKANNLVDLKHEQVFAMSTGANILFSFDGKFM